MVYAFWTNLFLPDIIGAMKKVITTDRAPKPVGPYSQAVVSNGFVFVAGQISIDPATNKVVEDDVASQTRRTMENLGAILKAAGSSFEKVVKTTIYVGNMSDFKTVNEVYAGFFPENPPARATIQAGALPLGLAVEIDCIAEA